MEDLVPNLVTPGLLLRVMQNLLREQVPIRDLRTILEAMLEVARDGSGTWKLGTRDVPDNPLRLVSGFQRLPDGHTVVVNWLGHGYLATTAQFFELDANKRVVRQFTDHGRFVSINKVQLLDVPGDPARDEIWR